MLRDTSFDVCKFHSEGLNSLKVVGCDAEKKKKKKRKKKEKKKKNSILTILLKVHIHSIKGII